MLSKESIDAMRECLRILGAHLSPSERNELARSTTDKIARGIEPQGAELEYIPLLFFPNDQTKATLLAESLTAAIASGEVVPTRISAPRGRRVLSRGLNRQGFAPPKSEPSSPDVVWLPFNDLAAWPNCPRVPNDSPLRYWLPKSMREDNVSEPEPTGAATSSITPARNESGAINAWTNYVAQVKTHGRRFFDANLVVREFGARMVNMATLKQWAKEKGYTLQSDPPLLERDMVQIEYLLCAIERAAKVPEDEVRAILKTRPELLAKFQTETRLAADDIEGLSSWLYGAERHRIWRERIRAGIESGELRELDAITGDEPGADAPSTAAGPDRERTEKEKWIRTHAISTPNIAAMLAGIDGRDANRWKRILGDTPKWLACALVSGAKAPRSLHWDPVMVADCVLQHFKTDKSGMTARLSGKFETLVPLKPWLERWAKHCEYSAQFDEKA